MAGKYAKGAKFEREIADILLEDNWLAVRSAGSHGIVDVLAVKQGVIWFIQCRTNGNLTEVEAKELLIIAKEHNGTAILASKSKGQYLFEEVKLKKPTFHYEIIAGRFTKIENE